jgi:alpha-L-rhamnosidase
MMNMNSCFFAGTPSIKRGIFRSVLISIIIPVCIHFITACQPDEGTDAMPYDLRCEYLQDPLGIENKTPRLGWRLQAEHTGLEQSAYQILVSDSKELLNKGSGNYWDSGKTKSAISTPILYQGKSIESKQQIYWKVRIWDQDDNVSHWSKIAYWERALDPEDWKAKWIGASGNNQIPTSIAPAPYFRKVVNVSNQVKKARVYVSGLGYYKMLINGHNADDRVLAPAPSNYDRRPLEDLIYFYDDQSTTRVYYNTFDVSELMKKGENVINMVLGNGWYNQRDRIVEGKMWYDTPRLIFQMEVEYQDGTTQTIVSDNTWKVATGPILYDGIFTGITYDARKEIVGWTLTEFDDTSWSHAKEVRAPTGKLIAQTAPPDRIIKTIKPVKIEQIADHKYSVDVGQMISGWVSLTMQGSSGAQVDMRFIEELGRDYGQKDSYIFKGDKHETFEPQFTWHAFRHVEISGLINPPQLEDIDIRIVHTDVDTAGFFECSNALFNRIHENYIRTQLGNFHGSFSSDCPHRERLGYTGDGQVITESTIFNFDMRQFYLKWLDDIDDARNKKTGYVPHTAPFGGGGGGPAWGSAYVIVPWLYYLYYGDSEVLSKHYEGMKHWVEYLGTRTDGDYIVVREEPNGWCLGDWATPDRIELPEPLVNTAYYYHVSHIMSKVAGVLQNETDQKHFSVLSDSIRLSFNSQFLDPETLNYWEGRQGANIFPLAFGLVPDSIHKEVLTNLIDHLKEIDEHFDTGILATPLLLDVLTDLKHHDLAYRIMNQRDFPSFGDYIEGKGATTLWENWDGGSSHSHPMYGSVIRWFYSDLAGINPVEEAPGFKKFDLKPVFPEDLKFVKCDYNSNYGLIRSEWMKKTKDIAWTIGIPANCIAQVYIPSISREDIQINEKSIDSCHEARFVREEDGRFIYEIKSGRYDIRSTM